MAANGWEASNTGQEWSGEWGTEWGQEWSGVAEGTWAAPAPEAEAAAVWTGTGSGGSVTKRAPPKEQKRRQELQRNTTLNSIVELRRQKSNASKAMSAPGDAEVWEGEEPPDDSGNYDYLVSQWLIQERYCCAGALANIEDGQIHSAAPGDKGWYQVWADDRWEKIMSDEDEWEDVWIHEATAIAECASGERPKNGLWLGGLKYQVTRQEKDVISGFETWVTIGVRMPMRGVIIYSTRTQIIISIFDQEQNQFCGNCRKATQAFAEYLFGLGA